MKFTREHVLSVLNKATAPMTTVAVAEACRLAAGARGGRAAESHEVRGALDKLAAEGLAVTATHREPGDHGYLVPFGEKSDRWWATPDLAGRVAAAVDAARLAREAADVDTARFKLLWEQAGGPPFDESIRWPYCHPMTGPVRGQAVIEIRATHEQVAWMIARLEELAPR